MASTAGRSIHADRSIDSLRKIHRKITQNAACADAPCGGGVEHPPFMSGAAGAYSEWEAASANWDIANAELERESEGAAHDGTTATRGSEDRSVALRTRPCTPHAPVVWVADGARVLHRQRCKWRWRQKPAAREQAPSETRGSCARGNCQPGPIRSSINDAPHQLRSYQRGPNRTIYRFRSPRCGTRCPPDEHGPTTKPCRRDSAAEQQRRRGRGRRWFHLRSFPWRARSDAPCLLRATHRSHCAGCQRRWRERSGCHAQGQVPHPPPARACTVQNSLQGR